MSQEWLGSDVKPSGLLSLKKNKKLYFADSRQSSSFA